MNAHKLAHNHELAHAIRSLNYLRTKSINTKAQNLSLN